jgi:DNA-binding beta-propeller fold protein YncE
MDGGSSKDRKHEAAPTAVQHSHRTSNCYRGESHVILLQQASDDYDAEADEDDVRIEVTTGGGKTHKITLPHKSTVLVLKQRLAQEAGFKPEQTRMFVDDDLREEELEEEEGLGSLRQGKGLAVMITMVVEEGNAQKVVPRLPAEADLMLGSCRCGGTGDQHRVGGCGGTDGRLDTPRGVAFVPVHPDWIVTSEYYGHRVKISNISTGALICKLGEKGSGEGQFNFPWGVAVTSDSPFVIVPDSSNHRLKVLRLVVAAVDRSTAHMEFVRHIGNGRGIGEGQLNNPVGVALLPGEGGEQETVLVTDFNQRVSQFKLDGTFIRIFAGGSEFTHPFAITVLGSSGEVAVADHDNHRVQIFDSEGNYKRQFGSEREGHNTDGQFNFPSALASDVHGNLLVFDNTSDNDNRLQVFSPEGKHLCTRTDLRLGSNLTRDLCAAKSVAWSIVGELAVTNETEANVLVWRGTK